MIQNKKVGRPKSDIRDNFRFIKHLFGIHRFSQTEREEEARTREWQTSIRSTLNNNNKNK